MATQMTAGFRYDVSGADFLFANAEIAANIAIEATMQAAVEHIQSHWSSVAPSLPGEPPAVVSGFLRNRIRIIRRGFGGRFVKAGDATAWSLLIETDYAAALEFGRPEINLAARPFLKPAIKAVEPLYGVKLGISFKEMASTAEAKTLFKLVGGQG